MSTAPEGRFPSVPAPILPCAITAFIMHCKSNGGGVVFGHLSTAHAGESQRTIVRMGLLEETLLSEGARWPGFRPGELFPTYAKEVVEGLGHDVRDARAAVSAGVGGMIAGSALCVRHGRSPRGKSGSPVGPAQPQPQ